MIEIPEGTRVYGIQLPIQAQSQHDRRRLGARRGRRRARARRPARRRRRLLLRRACATTSRSPRSYASRMSTFWRTASARCRGSRRMTTRTNLLSHVYVLPYRHPLVAAKQFSTLDYLSGGRAIVGIGAGHVQPEFELLGVDFSTGGGKLVDEKLPVLINALEHEWVDGYGASPRPVQQPRPPVWVAGSSPAAIRRAARLADGWLPQGPSDARHGRDARRDARAARTRRSADDDRPHHAVALRRHARLGRARRLAHRRGRRSSPSRSSPAPPRA